LTSEEETVFSPLALFPVTLWDVLRQEDWVEDGSVGVFKSDLSYLQIRLGSVLTGR
jgi:hypothetical protein